MLFLLSACAGVPPAGPSMPFAEAVAADVAARQPGWRRFEAPDLVWCSPSVDEDACWTGAVARDPGPGDAWRILTRDEAGRATRYEAGAWNAEGTHGVALEVAFQEEVPTTWGLRLQRLRGERVTLEVPVGPRLLWEWEASAVRAAAPGALGEALADARSLDRVATAATKALADAIRAAVARGSLERCAHGQYLGDGAPICEPVPLTEAQRRSAGGAAEREMAARLDAIHADAPIWSALLGELVPPGFAARWARTAAPGRP